MSSSRKKVLAVVGVLLFAFLSGAWVLFENSSGRISESLSELARGILSPGWFASIVFLGNYHARFGDWRDFTVIVSVSWIVWMFLFALIFGFTFKRKKNGKRA